ncbi:MAG: T9SS type A sorting domain-containing protein [Chitinophagaceae bacterium]|jgi:hypothetical protein
MKHFYKIFLFIILSTLSLTRANANFVVVGEGGLKALKCYPNPANNNINFEFTKTQDKNTRLIIFNFVGKQVVELKVENNKINLSLETFYRGLYLYKLVDRAGKVIDSGKFQVIK